MNQKNQVIKYIILSISALFLILIIGFIAPSKNITIFDKLIVGIVSIFGCLIGTSLAIHPGWYKTLKKRNQTSHNKSKKNSDIKFKGHHPNCDNFSNHTIVIKNKTYCAGCLGLIIGSVVSIILITFYFLFDFSKINFHLILILGILLILIIFIIIIYVKRNPYLRVISNTIFLLSFLIIVISILEITGDLVYGLLTVIFSFLLIDTRIRISKWSHSIICRDCEKDCKMY